MVDNLMLFPKIMNKARMSTCREHCIGGSSREIRQEKEIRLIVKTPHTPQKSQLELLSSERLQDIQSTYKNQMSFYTLQ
jgi:hypothetical protein